MALKEEEMSSGEEDNEDGMDIDLEGDDIQEGEDDDDEEEEEKVTN